MAQNKGETIKGKLTYTMWLYKLVVQNKSETELTW